MVLGHRCDECGSTGTARPWSDDGHLLVCDDCRRPVEAATPRAPVLLGDVLAAVSDAVAYAGRTSTTVPDARTSGATTCDACGAEAEWHRTLRGRWVMIEPGDRPVGTIPAGKRWRIAGDGTAVNLGRATPSDTCRISHFDVCPTWPAPSDSPALLALWRRNAQRRAG
ncbi:DUF6083 domain-containing protein [Streptomyces sp. SYSU K217416]